MKECYIRLCDHDDEWDVISGNSDALCNEDSRDLDCSICNINCTCRFSNFPYFDKDEENGFPFFGFFEWSFIVSVFFLLLILILFKNVKDGALDANSLARAEERIDWLVNKKLVELQDSADRKNKKIHYFYTDKQLRAKKLRKLGKKWWIF